MTAATATKPTNDNQPAAPQEVRETFRRQLPCKLTTEESARYGQMLSSKVRERELTDETRKSVAAEYGAKIKMITAEISRVAAALEKNEELRPIDCYKVFHAGTMQTIRVDTNEVVEVRPATDAERQAPLPGVRGETVMPTDTDFPEIEDGPTGAELAPGGTEVKGETVTSSVGDKVYHQPDDPGDDGDGTFDGIDEGEDDDKVTDRRPLETVIIDEGEDDEEEETAVLETGDDLDADLDAAYDERKRREDEDAAAVSSAEIVHQKKRGPKGPRKNKAAAAASEDPNAAGGAKPAGAKKRK
jgi:hypothetical protein